MIRRHKSVIKTDFQGEPREYTGQKSNPFKVNTRPLAGVFKPVLPCPGQGKCSHVPRVGVVVKAIF